MVKKRSLEWKRKEFEGNKVYKKKDLKNKLRPTGYEAFRVSPRTTTKFGKKYRKIYGASVEPDYTRPTKKKHIYGAKVKWYPHYYTKDTVKGGTRLLAQLKSYPVDMKEARSKLMLKKRKSPVKRRKKK